MCSEIQAACRETAQPIPESDAELARLAVQNEWEGLVIYGAVRQVDDLEELDIGIQALGCSPFARRYWGNLG